MKTLIAYATKYGCTEKCVIMLSKKLIGEVDICNLKETKNTALLQYDKIIIGGSIYMGRIQKEVNAFCLKNLPIFMNKKVGLFICCMREGDIAKTELNNAFPEELLSNAAAASCFGGELILHKMNFVDRLIIKKVIKIDKNTSNISIESIHRFARSMNET